MNGTAVVYIAGRNKEIDFHTIEKTYQGSDFFICPVCETGNFEWKAVSPNEVIGLHVMDYAFGLNPEEWICYIALSVSFFFLQKYATVILISNRDIFPLFPNADCDVSVFPYAIKTKSESLTDGSLNLAVQPLYCNASFAMQSSKQVLSFLSWCIQQYERILFNQNRNRGFLKTWLSYASLFGCSLNLQQHIAVNDTKKKCDNQFFENGMPIVDVLRRYYGLDYRLRRKCAGKPFQHPEYFVRDSVIVGDTHSVPVTAIEKAIYSERPDLQAAFSDLNNPEMRIAFTEWFLKYAQNEYALADSYLEPVKEAYDAYRSKRETKRDKKCFVFTHKKEKNTKVNQYPFGVNLCGFIKGNFGLGESIRILARILEHEGIPYTIIEVQDSALHTFTDMEFEGKISNEFIYNTNIFAYNPDCLEDTIKEFDKSIFKGRHNIGYWAWEMPEFPEGWEKAFPYFDEIWTLSDFTTQCILQKSPIPVYTVSYAIAPQKDDMLTRKDFGLPQDKFIFLLTYDTRSISERKNPMAAVSAFCKAFDGREDVCLLIKLNTPLEWDGDNFLTEAMEYNGNIMIVNRQMSKLEVNSLIALCDAYISLHRSEGFGLGPAEAMAFGKPVVITNFGGNTQYMREGACCPVPYQLIELEKDFGIYKKGMHWADPNIDAAAEYMKKLVDDQKYYAFIAQNAKEMMETDFSYVACGGVMRDRLKRLEQS